MTDSPASAARLTEGLRSLLARLPEPVYRRVRPFARAGYWLLTPHRTPARIAFLRARRRAQEQARPAEKGAQGKVEAFWAASPEERQLEYGAYWMAHPLVRRRLNVKASGDPDVDAYGHLARLLAEQGWRFPVSRVLSLGCGHGSLERGLVGLRLAERYDGIDISPAAIASAQRLAADAKLDGQIRYHVGDLESADLPEAAFDIVFAHQSVHHIEDLDGLFRAVRRALRPGGVLHLHEFVGQDRFQWTDAQLRHINGFVEALPSRYRRLQSGGLREPCRRPTIADMIAADPSEAIRSSAIPEAVRRHFRVIEQRDLGGGLLHMGLSAIGQNFDPDNPEDVAQLEAFFDLEDRLMAEGVIASDFVTITAVRD